MEATRYSESIASAFDEGIIGNVGLFHTMFHAVYGRDSIGLWMSLAALEWMEVENNQC